MYPRAFASSSAAGSSATFRSSNAIPSRVKTCFVILQGKQFGDVMITTNEDSIR